MSERNGRLSADEGDELQRLPRVVGWICSKCGDVMPEDRHRCSCDGGGSPWGSYYTDDPDPADVLEDKLAKDDLLWALEALSLKQRQLLERRYGLHGRPPESIHEIARDMGVTADKAREIEDAALKVLGRNARIGGWHEDA